MIEDNYFHAPNAAALDDASIDGMVEALRKRYDDKFSHYFTADELKLFERADLGPVPGRRAERHRGSSAACG